MGISTHFRRRNCKASKNGHSLLWEADKDQHFMASPNTPSLLVPLGFSNLVSRAGYIYSRSLRSSKRRSRLLIVPSHPTCPLIPMIMFDKDQHIGSFLRDHLNSNMLIGQVNSKQGIRASRGSHQA